MMLDQFPVYVERAAATYALPPPQWLRDDRPAGRMGRGLYGYVYLIDSQCDLNPLQDSARITPSDALETRLSFNWRETWGLQVWGDKAEDLVYALAAGRGDAVMADIAASLDFAVLGTGSITSVDEEVLARDKRNAKRRMALDIDVAYVRHLTRTVPAEGNVIDVIPWTVRRNPDIRAFTTARQS